MDNEVVEGADGCRESDAFGPPVMQSPSSSSAETTNPDPVADAYKGACTDALSKCASYLGIGMDVYKGLYENPALENRREPCDTECGTKSNFRHRMAGEERRAATHHGPEHGGAFQQYADRPGHARIR